jgi:RHS repeat-associated protein
MSAPMKTPSLRTRVVAAATLLSFSWTTLAPSLAWAAEGSRAASGPRRVADEPPSELLEPSREQAAVAEHAAEAAVDESSTTPKRASDVLRDKLGGTAAEGTTERSSETPASAGGYEKLALPTGGDKSGVTSQSISVPKGSGTIQGMGESFSAQLSTGIATFSVPFALAAARGGAQPSLGLSYSSGSGSGLAGMGWSVGVPYIARQTDRGLPGYDDRSAWHANQDRFVFNGGQELVPICLVQGQDSCQDGFGADRLIAGEKLPSSLAGYQYFRPRVEGSFLRFFWSPDHRSWVVQDKSGVTMELGSPLDGVGDDSTLEVNPDARSQIFRWHLARQYDTYRAGNGQPVNVVVYKYEQDGGQAYLSDIYDTTPAATPTDTKTLDGFAHHTHLRYESRSDPTETYHSGWLIQQTLRLVGVDVTSKTADGPGSTRRLVRRYHLDYDSAFHTSYLSSVQVEGRCAEMEADAPAEQSGQLGSTNCPKLPPMTFGYRHVKGFDTAGTAVESGLAGYEAFDARIQQMGGDPPHSIDEELTDYFDVNSDGLPDVLVTAPGVYGNDFGVFFNSEDGIRKSFGDVAQLGVSGVLGANSGTIKLSNANVAPLDFDGDGRVDFLHMPKVKTYAVYRFTPPSAGNSKWMLVGDSIVAANQQSPKIDLGRDAAETRIADVNFDGMVDLVVSTGTEFQTFLSLNRLPGGYGQFGSGQWSSATTASLSNDAIAQCVPYSGTPVRFSDSDIQLADMNGDGIQDIVRLRRGDVRYWPGRGNGFWGTGKLDDCPAGTFGDKRYVAMDTAPYYSDIQGTSLRLDDVNGDGLDDLVQVRMDAVDVWLNVDGHGWTQRDILDSTVPSPSFANRVRLIDINGSGTRDIVWGNGKRYEFIDLAGGERPGLLTRVENGLGKSTDIEYSTSTELMLAAERTGVPCSEQGAFDSKWCSKMPTIAHVVKRVTESDNLSVAGSGKSQYVTEYDYRDPLYEGRQREFRGFRRARSKRVGDANSPSDFTESTFLLGECENEEALKNDCSQGWQDNPREALKGLPIITERYDERGVYLSTEATNYRLRHLYAGLDGREVRHASESHKRTTLYDTAGPMASGSPQAQFSANVELDTTTPSLSYPSASTSKCVAPTEAPVITRSTSVPLRATSNYAVTESAAFVDAFGNAYLAMDLGCTDGDACPTAIEGNDANEAICSFTLPELVTGSSSRWLYRTTDSWAQGSAQTAVRKRSLTSYSPEGAPTETSVVLSGTVLLDRFHAYGEPIAKDPPLSHSVDGVRSVLLRTYDQFGNLTRETGPAGLGRCRDVSYDEESYQQLPMGETIYTGGCGKGELLTIASYDRGLGLVTRVTDPNVHLTTVKYDGFGRLTELYRPLAVRKNLEQSPLEQSPVPAVRIEYSLPSPQDPRAYSTIHTWLRSGEDENYDLGQFLESYSFVDGMGRARVGLSQADETEDGAPWIVSSIAEFDAKGAVRRKYLPFFFQPQEISGLPAGDAAPQTQYGRQRYDAFGRQIQTFDVDGTVTLQSRYHALSTDLWDAADLYPGPHQGSYATTRTDGHGRTIETTERVHDAGVLDLRYTRSRFLPTGEPTVISRVRSGSPTVMRWMRYDSLGRMVLNVDPHTTGNFTTNINVDATPVATTGLKAWRYAYNDAGDLVGTSDARGCGVNFHYDGAGRLYGEDYSPCLVQHNLYSAPSLGATPYDVSSISLTELNRLEVFYQFDSAPTSPVAAPTEADGYTASATRDLVGRLAAVHDRAASTWFAYDALGRTITTFRKVAFVYPRQPNQLTMAQRYVDRWYHQDFKYDTADRLIEQTTGATTNELKASDGTSEIRTAYTKRGTLKSVDSSYGELVKHVKRSADGLVQSVSYGDAATTETAMSYDSRRRLRSVQTFRQAANLWSTAPPSVSPVPAASDVTRQLLLQDLDYSYDVVNNPTEIRDWRTADEWPAGAKPVSRRMEYDDLYRVTRVDYEYPNGSDAWTSPFAADVPTGDDPRRQAAVGMRILSKRPLWQTFKYDWLGNTTATDDDQHAQYDRSLGTISSYATSDVNTSKPYQLKDAGQPGQGIQLRSYDPAGNLTWFVGGRGTSPCTIQADCQLLQYFYQWDEVGRLVYASQNTNKGPFLRYLYDANDERVVKEYRALVNPPDPTLAGPKITTLYVFDTLEIRRSPFNEVTKQFPVDATNEVVHLSANGVRLARVHYEPPSKGEPQLVTPDAKHASNLHIFLNLPDHLGSSSLIIDHATSELVEARTYQPYGATESDYRPERWKGFREDYGFTGKEEDVEVGLQYFGKRYLSPYLGRWISPDPLAVHAPGSADLNLYAYVSGAVLKAVDPVGLDWYTGTDGAPSVEQPDPYKGQTEGRAPNDTFIKRLEAGRKWLADKGLAALTKLVLSSPEKFHETKARAQRLEMKPVKTDPVAQVGNEWVKDAIAHSATGFFLVGGFAEVPGVPTPSGALSRVSDLASLAERARGALGIEGNYSLNVAIFEVKVGDSYYYLGSRNIRGSAAEWPTGTKFGHSELLDHKLAGELGVDSSQVTRIFSERAPCSGPVAACSKMLSKNYPGVEVESITSAAGKEGEQAIKNFYDARAAEKASK